MGGDNTGKTYKPRSDIGASRAPSAKEPGYWTKINRGKRGKKASCHPSKPHYAKGFCKTCYCRNKWETDPVWRERQKTLSRVREQRRPLPRHKTDAASVKAKRDATFYNLLPGEREKIWQFQNGIDPISGAPLVAMANLDHDHKTGLIRGLLNPITNKFLVDDEKRLQAMLSYIRNPPAPLALGETVYGLVGQAKHKKHPLYGPDRTLVPQPRRAK